METTGLLYTHVASRHVIKYDLTRNNLSLLLLLCLCVPRVCPVDSELRVYNLPILVRISRIVYVHLRYYRVRMYVGMTMTKTATGSGVL